MVSVVASAIGSVTLAYLTKGRLNLLLRVVVGLLAGSIFAFAFTAFTLDDPDQAGMGLVGGVIFAFSFLAVSGTFKRHEPLRLDIKPFTDFASDFINSYVKVVGALFVVALVAFACSRGHFASGSDDLRRDIQQERP